MTTSAANKRLPGADGIKYSEPHLMSAFVSDNVKNGSSAMVLIIMMNDGGIYVEHEEKGFFKSECGGCSGYINMSLWI